MLTLLLTSKTTRRHCRIGHVHVSAVIATEVTCFNTACETSVSNVNYSMELHNINVSYCCLSQTALIYT